MLRALLVLILTLVLALTRGDPMARSQDAVDRAFKTAEEKVRGLQQKKQFAEAIEAWNVLFRDYTSSDKLPDARVKKGMALEKLGRRSQALVEYRYVMDRFPNTQAARIARERLTP